MYRRSILKYDEHLVEGTIRLADHHQVSRLGVLVSDFHSRVLLTTITLVALFSGCVLGRGIFRRIEGVVVLEVEGLGVPLFPFSFLSK
jgi:hypothetical protein